MDHVLALLSSYMTGSQRESEGPFARSLRQMIETTARQLDSITEIEIERERSDTVYPPRRHDQASLSKFA